ncbi:MAG: DUF86 domain-containing protein [Deltaproteobacteria bacterium]|nr:DUF86 domain-containing protein [Deltaproteobacteria bacterium]
MKSARTYVDYLRDILDAARKAEEFTRDVSFDDFKANDEKIFAVVRALEIVGEAVKKIPSAVRRRYPTIPWRDMAGMRDKLIHHYFGVDVAVVWRTVKDGLPPIHSAIRGLLADLERQ